jgi:hypothetical protein
VGCGVRPSIAPIRCGKLKEVVLGCGAGHSTWWMKHVVLEVWLVLILATLALWTHGSL